MLFGLMKGFRHGKIACRRERQPLSQRTSESSHVSKFAGRLNCEGLDCDGVDAWE